MTTLRSLLSPGYEPGDGTMDGAQLIDGHWWHPLFGCDSLQYVVDNARQSPAPQVAIPAEQYQFNPKQSTTPMTFDPTSIEPPDELIRKRQASNTSFWDDYIFFARWGAAQMIKTDDLTDTVEDVIRGSERHHQAGCLCTIATELEGSNA